MKYYFYHGLSWPQLSYVAEDEKGHIVGELARTKNVRQVLIRPTTDCNVKKVIINNWSNFIDWFQRQLFFFMF